MIRALVNSRWYNNSSNSSSSDSNSTSNSITNSNGKSNRNSNSNSNSNSNTVSGRNPAPPLQPYICQCITCTPVPPSSMSNDMLTGGAGFPSLAQTHFDTVPSNNIKLGAGGFKCRPLKVVQDFFHPQYWNFVCAWMKNCKEAADRSWRKFWPYAWACQITNLAITGHGAWCMSIGP